jgi:hypothetical protein
MADLVLRAEPATYLGREPVRSDVRPIERLLRRA